MFTKFSRSLLEFRLIWKLGDNKAVRQNFSGAIKDHEIKTWTRCRRAYKKKGYSHKFTLKYYLLTWYEYFPSTSPNKRPGW